MNINQETIVRYLQQTASMDEQKKLDQWLNEKSSHRDYFDQVKLIWESADCNVDKEIVDMDKAWDCINSRISSVETKQIIPVGMVQWLRIAASVVLVIGVGLGLLFFESSPSAETLAMVETISVGDVEEVLLPDGSVVTLMPHSTLRYTGDFTDARKVALSGGAYFDVQKTSGKSFEVITEQLGVKVLGTKFMIRQSNLKTEVYVEEGKVEVGLPNDADKRVISTHEGVYLDNTTKNLEAIKTSMDNMLSWKTGILEFNNVRLNQVLAELGRHYNVSVKLKNSRIGNCHLTSKFDNKSIAEVLEVLEIVLNVEISSTSPNEYLISGKGC